MSNDFRSPCLAAPYSVAAGDFNGDGKADLAVANNFSITVSILLGNGNGTFLAVYLFNATVVPQASFGFLTLWPQGITRPVAATLNALDGAITNDMAIVPTSNTEISAFASDLTHLILDISGYFAP